MKIKGIIMCLTAAAMAAVTTACGSKTVIYTTDDYINLSVSGVNGEGRLEISSGDDDFLQMVNRDLFDGKASDIDLASIVVNIAAYTDCVVDGGRENLSNGDKITVTVDADNEELEKLGLGFALDEYVYTVEGLAEPTVIDVFSNVSVTFEGISPNGSAKAEYMGTDEFIRNNVSYYISDSYGLANGDTITVKADCSQYVLDENFYVINEKEKTFTVEGLSYYAEDLNGFDLTDIDAQLLNEARDVIDRSSYMDAYSSDSKIYGNKIFKNGNVSLEWKVTGDYTITPCKKILYFSEDSDRNVYTVFYRVNIPLQKVDENPYCNLTCKIQKIDRQNAKKPV